ncbi:MAG TPA: nuclear transport factor 2 family protein [Arenimonas sp.]|tara:strand:+ start:147 stop:605 length:459 start_codon:yes stop_codon:yes gene_type:complete
MRTPFLLAVLMAVAGCASQPATRATVDLDALTREVAAAETAFAQSMADRDIEAFAGFLAEDAIFQPGPDTLRGKAAILAAWGKYFEGPQAPFSWRPETVVVLDGGQLAQTKGPVFDPAGKAILEFRSTWRRDPDGRWKVVFDDGTCLCGKRG